MPSFSKRIQKIGSVSHGIIFPVEYIESLNLELDEQVQIVYSSDDLEEIKILRGKKREKFIADQEKLDKQIIDGKGR